MAMALHALADDLAVKHIERREKGGDAVPLIVVGDGAGTSLLHRRPRLGAVQRLDLAFLINRENDGVVRRIDVEADELFELGRERDCQEFCARGTLLRNSLRVDPAEHSA